MSVGVRWLRVAALEAREARRFYDDATAGLGERFVDELEATIKRIVEFPRAWPECEPPVRRAVVNRFPYLVHYVLDDRTVVVLGVYHAKRRPISWRERLEQSV